jgi:hypothetical protein
MSITLASADAEAVPGGTRGRPLRPGTRRLERADGRLDVVEAGLAGQPRVPSRRTARLIAAATLSAEGASDRCSAEANSASHRASSTFSRVLAVLPAGDVLAGEGTGSPGAGAPRRAKRAGSPPVSRTCVWMDVPDEVVTVSLLTSRLSCCCG